MLTGFFFYRPAGWLLVTGEDASEFLQGQFTNNLPASIAHSCTYGLWLDRKGRVQGDGFVLGGDSQRFQIFSCECSGAVLRERLEAFIIADDVEVVDRTEEIEAVSLMGDEAAAFLENSVGLPEPGRYLEVEGGVVFRGRRSKANSFEWIFDQHSRGKVQDLLRTSELAGLAGSDLERERIRSGIPSVPRDIGPRDLPQEGGLEVDAVSFRKGCYLGQEVMARLQATGRVRRRLIRVRVSGGASANRRLFLDTKEVGELRSFISGDDGGPNGLAMVRVDVPLSASEGFSFEAGGETRVVPVMEKNRRQ